MKTAVVILNYNGQELLQRFLPSVLRHSGEAQIYVADNASTDDSLSLLANQFPQVKIIVNDDNYGFAKGYNLALRHVGEDIICLLNNDVEVSEAWLGPILDEFQANQQTAIIQPKILDCNNPGFFEHAGAAGGFIDRYGFPFCRGRIFETVEKDRGQYDDDSEIFWASGACLFVRKQLWQELNGFDETFFAHMEEIDFCWRAFNSGYTAKCIPRSKVFHLGGGTLQYGNPKKTYLNFRNNLLMMVKNLPSRVFSTMFIRLSLDGLAAIKFLLALKPSCFFAVLRAHLSFYRLLLTYIQKRYTIKSDRKYHNHKSVVWSYFIKGRKHFHCL